MIKDIEKVFFSVEDIQAMVKRLGKEISEDYKDKNLMLICVLKGSVCFMADLMREITIPCRIEFMTAKSYGNSTQTSGEVDVTRQISCDLDGYDLIIVEDIFDSGRTLQKVTQVLKDSGAKSVACCSLLDKPERRDESVKLKLDYTGARVPDAFVVGYGLDYAEKYRNLPFIGVLKPEIYTN